MLCHCIIIWMEKKRLSALSCFLLGSPNFQGVRYPYYCSLYRYSPHYCCWKGQAYECLLKATDRSLAEKKQGFNQTLRTLLFFSRSVFGTNLTKPQRPQRLVNGSQPNLVRHRLRRNLRPSNLHSLVGLSAADGVITSGIVDALQIFQEFVLFTGVNRRAISGSCFRTSDCANAKVATSSAFRVGAIKSGTRKRSRKV